MSICNLCEAFKNERDKFLMETSDFFILPTKDMKGHHKRIMIVSKEHLPYGKVRKAQLINWSIRFTTFCRDYFDEEPTFAICSNDYCSIPDHWHMIACDWFGTPEEIQQLHYTSHTTVKSKVKWEPKR